MTKKQLVVIFCVAIVFYYWWNETDSDRRPAPSTANLAEPNFKKKQNSSHDKNRVPLATATSTQAQTSATSPAKPVVLSTGATHRRPITTTQQQKSPDAVPFKNYKGMAIAYGDVLLGKLQENIAEGYAAPPTVDFWPSAAIPYHIQPDVPQPERILKALEYLSEKTVLEFVPIDETITDAIVFEKTDAHCFSYVGRISGTQPIFISAGCEWFHIVHEVLHAIGMVHEHSRSDRDQFISILWDNIPPLFRSQFEIMPDSLLKHWLSYDYDTQSIMHYGSQVFTEQPKGYSLIRKDNSTIPEPRGLSPMDIQKINDLFQGR